MVLAPSPPFSLSLSTWKMGHPIASCSWGSSFLHVKWLWFDISNVTQTWLFSLESLWPTGSIYMFALSNGGCTGCSTAQPSLHVAIFPSFSSACSGNRGKLASLIDKLMFNQGMKCNSPLFVVPPPPNLWSLLPSFGEWDEISFSHEHYISQKAKDSFTSQASS